MTIELRHLRYVAAVAECRSFRAAARMLGVRESAVSRRVRDLEDEIGAALFIRTPGGVTLTFAGKRFLGPVSEALSLISDAARDVGAAGRGEQGGVRMGIVTSMASCFVAKLLEAYGNRNPNVRLDLVEGALGEHISAVQQHRIDVAFLFGQSTINYCDVEHLWDERVFVTLPECHSLAHKDRIAWTDLRDQNFIVSDVDPGSVIYDCVVGHLMALSQEPSIERHSVGRDNLMQLVALNRGVSLTNEGTTALQFPGVVFRELEGDVMSFSAVWSPRNDNPALRRFLSQARLIRKALLSTSEMKRASA